jgi:hypothetical protein
MGEKSDRIQEGKQPRAQAPEAKLESERQAGDQRPGRPALVR